MSEIIDLIGQRFGRLLVLEKVNNGKWLCECNCKKIVEVKTNKLKSGHTKSCGCLKKDATKLYFSNNRVWKYESGQNIKDNKRDIIITERFHDIKKHININVINADGTKVLLKKKNYVTGKDVLVVRVLLLLRV